MMRALMLLLAGVSCIVTADRAQAQEGRPFTLPDEVRDVNGVIVTLKPTIAFAEAGATGGVDVHIVVDLADLQAKMQAIARSFPLPSNNCASFKPDNIVASISSASLVPSGSQAILRLAGDVDIWSCFENPIPKECSVHMETQDFGLFKTDVPVTVCVPGDPIKNRTISQPVDAALPVSLIVQDARHIGLQIGTPDITLGGALAGVTNGILSVAGLDINEEARKAILSAIDPNDLLLAIPDDFDPFQPTVASAAFVDRAGALVADIHLRATPPPGWLLRFLASFVGLTP